MFVSKYDLLCLDDKPCQNAQDPVTYYTSNIITKYFQNKKKREYQNGKNGKFGEIKEIHAQMRWMVIPVWDTKWQARTFVVEPGWEISHN